MDTINTIGMVVGGAGVVKGVGGTLINSTEKSILETSWFDSNGKIQYPPNSGFQQGTEKIVTVDVGYTFGRYGKVEPGVSNFVTEAGVSADKLSLPPTTNPNTYKEYIVLKPIEATAGKVAPWGGSSGGGTQFVLDKPITWYEQNGYIAPKGK